MVLEEIVIRNKEARQQIGSFYFFSHDYSINIYVKQMKILLSSLFLSFFLIRYILQEDATYKLNYI